MKYVSFVIVSDFDYFAFSVASRGEFLKSEVCRCLCLSLSDVVLAALLERWLLVKVAVRLLCVEPTVLNLILPLLKELL
jgi:hypothetical protein